MTTLSKSIHSVSSPQRSFDLSISYAKLIKQLEFSYFGIIAMTITIGSCLGGITTMQIFSHDAPIWQFIVALSLAMANNVAAIGQAPMKWIAPIFILNVIINGALLLANML